MRLNDKSKRFLLSRIRQFTTAEVYLCREDGEVVVATRPREHMPKIWEPDGDGTGYVWEPCSAGDGSRIYLVTENTKDSRQIISYVNLQLQLILSAGVSVPDALNAAAIEPERQLTHQLALYKSQSWETTTHMKALNRSFDVFRCAVLFQFREKDAEMMDPDWFFLMSTDSSEDIKGYFGYGRILVFHCVSGTTEEERFRDVKKYAANMQRLLETIYHCRVTAYIGSAYDQISGLHNSFSEADFLLRNAAFLQPRDFAYLSIDHYFFAYLVGQLPPSYRAFLFKGFDRVLADRPRMRETLIALAANSFSLKQTAEALHIHRNTIHQRSVKLAETLELNPFQNRSDRMLLHGYAIHKVQKNVLRACVNVHFDSLQYLALETFSRILYEKTDGSFLLETYPVSQAADYRNSIKAVLNGELDCISANINFFNDHFQPWLDVLGLPFLFESPDALEHAANHTVRHEWEQQLLPQGAVLLGFFSEGIRYITSDRPIVSPSDLRGKRIRILPHANSVKQYFQAIGARPVETFFNEVPVALSAGVIDCQENPATIILNSDVSKFHTYLLDLDLLLDLNIMLFSSDTWNTLPAAVRDIIRVSFQEMLSVLKEKRRDFIRGKRAELIDQGMRLTRPSGREIELWRTVARSQQRLYQDADCFKKLMKR